MYPPECISSTDTSVLIRLVSGYHLLYRTSNFQVKIQKQLFALCKVRQKISGFFHLTSSSEVVATYNLSIMFTEQGSAQDRRSRTSSRGISSLGNSARFSERSLLVQGFSENFSVKNFLLLRESDYMQIFYMKIYEKSSVKSSLTFQKSSRRKA